MSTARQIIKRAMQKAGIITKNEAPSADEANDALDTLNDMLASWSNESLMIYTRELNNFTLSGGTASYTMGTGGTFNTSRPVVIVASYIRSGETDLPVTLITDEQYADIPDKDTQGIPYWMNYTNGFPLSTVKLFPIPSSNYVLYILSEKVLSQFTLDDEVDLPTGWRKALIDNLAIELAPEYGQPPDPLLLRTANKSKGNLKLSIIKNRTLDSFPTNGRFRNINSGYYN